MYFLLLFCCCLVSLSPPFCFVLVPICCCLLCFPLCIFLSSLLLQNACREVERAIASECRELLPRIRAASPREVSGIVSASVMDWTPRLKRNGSRVCKVLKAAARLVRNGDVLMEASPDYPHVVAKFFTRVLTALVGTSSEHRKLMLELRKVRKDARNAVAYPPRVPAMERGYTGGASARDYRRETSSRDAPSQPSHRRESPPSAPVLTALRRHFANARLAPGTCWCCEFLRRKPADVRHSARVCPHIDEAERLLRSQGLLN